MGFVFLGRILPLSRPFRACVNGTLAADPQSAHTHQLLGNSQHGARAHPPLSRHMQRRVTGSRPSSAISEPAGESACRADVRRPSPPSVTSDDGRSPVIGLMGTLSATAPPIEAARPGICMARTAPSDTRPLRALKQTCALQRVECMRQK